MSFKKNFAGLAGFILCLFAASIAFANVEQVKIYKKAYPDEKPKCVQCHKLEKPKKDNYELNDYGNKVKELQQKPDVEAYKTAGMAPAAEK